MDKKYITKRIRKQAFLKRKFHFLFDIRAQNAHWGFCWQKASPKVNELTQDLEHQLFSPTKARCSTLYLRFQIADLTFWVWFLTLLFSLGNEWHADFGQKFRLCRNSWNSLKNDPDHNKQAYHSFKQPKTSVSIRIKNTKRKKNF